MQLEHFNPQLTPLFNSLANTTRNRQCSLRSLECRRRRGHPDVFDSIDVRNVESQRGVRLLVERDLRQRGLLRGVAPRGAGRQKACNLQSVTREMWQGTGAEQEDALIVCNKQEANSKRPWLERILILPYQLHWACRAHEVILGYPL